MKNSICYIDDKIPFEDFYEVDDTALIHQSVLSYMAKNSLWEEEIVKNLVENLLAKRETWDLIAFKNPEFFLKFREQEICNPEIIIFDWDYGSGPSSVNSENWLLEILETTIAYVHIFTHADNNNEVKQAIEKEDFKKFTNRISLSRKDEPKSVEKVIGDVSKQKEENFSLQFGKELLFNANKSINEILTQVSHLSIKEFLASFGKKTSDGNFIIPIDDFSSIVSEKFMHELRKQGFTTLKQPISKEKTPGLDAVNKLWSYRLYHSPSDNQVRQGDIIRNKSTNQLYLVLSSDCHILDFWEKNFGHLALIPLIEVKNDSTFTQKFKKMRNVNNISSLTSPTLGATILPALPIEKNFEGKSNVEFCNFLVNAKGIITIHIAKPENYQPKNLIYDNWENFSENGTKRYSISEPFKSPLIYFIINKITDFGCPDFPNALSQDMMEELKDALK